MYTLFIKEIRNFLTSLVGYVAIIVFLTLTGLFLWVISTETTGLNILENQFATIDPLFAIAPWVYLFLIPAITMRSFSEERKAGTIELLFTRPLSDLQIILAKYFAGVALVVISLLPTLLYYYTVTQLVPKDAHGVALCEVDTGGMWGSYFGLTFLGAGFVAIGIFASSISENQVVAFILAMLLCYLSYFGFDFLGNADLFGSLDAIIIKLGINDHYISMSRGVLDTRDLVYFLSLISVFVLLTKLVLEKRKW